MRNLCVGEIGGCGMNKIEELLPCPKCNRPKTPIHGA